MTISLTAAPAAQGTIRRLAQEFEAQAVAAMFQPVFAALPTDGPFGGGKAEAQWRPLLVDAIARDLARAGGLGLAAPVERELLRAQELAGRAQGQGDQA
ncbi:rod-binding protein [Falsiroseomonas oryziterrae]|uniref:rod-binding protein n=1 Tax=Falsiroseomonas oryziterrae TaxID=2911368 RepID=UPI001F43798E|nr:rod-binding protein [Roseomonas sp. NPKOSM-4]